MEALIFIILVTLTVGLLGWAVARMVFSAERLEHRRLQRRLSGQHSSADSSAQQTLLLLQENQAGLSGILAQKGYFRSLARKLQATGSQMSLVRFFGICVGFGLCGAIAAIMISNSMLVAVVATAAGMFLPFTVINRRHYKRLKAFTEQLPEALDFLSRILRAGHSLSTGLQMMGTELPDPLATEFRRCYDQHSLGAPLEDCLRDMAQRIDSTDFSFFVTAVLIQRTTGGDLSQVLNNISGMVRGRIRLQSYVKAKTAEGRFTGYILVAFPVIMFFIAYTLNPEYSGLLIRTSTGLKLMATAGGMEVMGLWAIKKITTIKV